MYHNFIDLKPRTKLSVIKNNYYHDQKMNIDKLVNSRRKKNHKKEDFFFNNNSLMQLRFEKKKKGFFSQELNEAFDDKM